MFNVDWDARLNRHKNVFFSLQRDYLHRRHAAVAFFTKQPAFKVSLHSSFCVLKGSENSLKRYFMLSAEREKKMHFARDQMQKVSYFFFKH